HRHQRPRHPAEWRTRAPGLPLRYRNRYSTPRSHPRLARQSAQRQVSDRSRPRRKGPHAETENRRAAFQHALQGSFRLPDGAAQVMRTLLLLAAALPMAAQPKLLVNAQLETRSAAAGLESQFKALLSAQPQPAWIAYSV